MADVPEGDPRPKRKRHRYASDRRVERFESRNQDLACTRYEKTADGLRIERRFDAREQLVATNFGVYVLKGGKSTLIHCWGHGPGIYIPF